jgi:UDP-hydrolysing UDP-N-acetyl-D-glucosamine 2-epimerase
MAKTIGVAVLGLADLFGRMRPDLLLLIADRYEMLAPASVALALRIPIAHIEGGEISEGAIDDAVRNSLTMMSHIHFTSTHAARQKLLSKWARKNGAFTARERRLWIIFGGELFSRAKNWNRSWARISPRRRCWSPIIPSHSFATRLRNRMRSSPLSKLSRINILFCYPNADAGSRALIERSKSFLASRNRGAIFTNLDAITYWSLLRHVKMLIGNSSSGIMETASFELPTLNVGIRQQGRERARNVLDAAAEKTAILKAIEIAASAEFRQSLAGMTNPYGDGHASEKIVEVLTSIPLTPELLLKRHAPPISVADRAAKSSAR